MSAALTAPSAAGAPREPEESDIGNVLLYALAAGTAGALYRMATHYRQETYAINDLVSPAPTAFEVAPQSRHFFGEFTRFRRCDNDMYLAAFHATDWLLNMERTLGDYRAEPNDEMRCSAWHAVAHKSAGRLCRAYLRRHARTAAPHLIAAEKRRVTELLESFRVFLGQCLGRLTALCNSIHKLD